MKGIYGITNAVNGKVYVGSSKSISRRWKEHRKMLRGNIHHSSHLQYSWNKYGEENFTFEVIEEVEDVERIFEREAHWIIEWNTLDAKYGYNMCLPNGGAKREESIQKLRDHWNVTVPHNYIGCHKEYLEMKAKGYEKVGMKWLKKDRVKGFSRTKRAVDQYDFNFTLIGSYDSIIDAARATGLSDKIGGSCRGDKKSCGGFYWKFREESLEELKTRVQIKDTKLMCGITQVKVYEYQGKRSLHKKNFDTYRKNKAIKMVEVYMVPSKIERKRLTPEQISISNYKYLETLN